jgi:hypothetical protein
MRTKVGKAKKWVLGFTLVLGVGLIGAVALATPASARRGGSTPSTTPQVPPVVDTDTPGLAFTGTALPVEVTLALGIGMLILGVAVLVFAARRHGRR